MRHVAERRESQPRADDAVHFFAQQQLGERELLLRFERLHRLIPDAQDGLASHSFLVVLDFPFDEQLVFVLE